MIFIGAALLIAALLGVIISADAGSLVGLTQEQTGQLVPLVLILIVVAGGAFGRRQRFSDLLGNALTWVAIFGIAVIGYSYRHQLGGIADRVLGELVPGAAIVVSEGGAVTIKRALGGTFRVNTGINGVTVPMIFDTGASAMVLTQTDARLAGINLNGLRYTLPVQTANGTGRAALVRLDEVSIGPIVRRNITAFVVEAQALETSLLGMSFLETLETYAVSGDTLTLKG